MKQERKKPVKRTLEERTEIAREKLKNLEDTTDFRECKRILSNKDLTITQRMDSLRDYLLPEEEEEIDTPEVQTQP